ncbi:MAG TPA: AAA family ATPase [Candidatus Sulfotelmatobacter sp.]|nr:AAA family ATPase [Candidatus Sulfotelmatobacter sp.]
MFLMDSLSGAVHKTLRQAEFVAFLADEESTLVMDHFAVEQMIPHSLVRQGTVDHAIAVLNHLERPPQRLVVDISASSMPLSDLARLADACAPSVSVVVIGDRNDVGLFRELLRMGVDDYISKPLTIDLLRRILGANTPAAEQNQQVRTGKVVACIGARGGAGATTVAVNLAWSLANQQHRRVALIDLDPHGGPANVLLGTQSNEGLADVLKNVNNLDPHYVNRTLVSVGPYLSVLSSEMDFSAGTPPDLVALKRLLNELKKHFHYIIADLPYRAGPLSQCITEAAQTVVVVSEPSVYSARETARVIRMVETRDNHASMMLVINHQHPAGKAELAVKDFEEAVGRKVSMELPHDFESAAEAENLGPPLVTRSGLLAQALRELANDLSGRRDEKAAEGKLAQLLAKAKAVVERLLQRQT